MLRPLIPKGPRSPSYQATLQPDNVDPRLREPSPPSTPQAKRAQVRVACVACQRHKAKASQALDAYFWILVALTVQQCDGHRPSCARCTRRRVVCKYDVEPDVSRFKSVQRRNEALQTERDLLYRLAVYMSTRSEAEAQEAFRRLRTCDDPLEVAKSLSD